MKSGTIAINADATTATITTEGFGSSVLKGLTHIPGGTRAVFGYADVVRTIRDVGIGHVHGRFVEGAGVGIKIWKGMDPLIGS